MARRLLTADEQHNPELLCGSATVLPTRGPVNTAVLESDD
jgi:hypothetical protein